MANWANIVFGIFERQVRRVEIHDDDNHRPILNYDEQLVRIPMSRYQLLSSDDLENELT